MKINLLLSKGIWLSLFTVVLWAISNVYIRVAYVQWHIHPIVFSCIMLFSASFILLVIAGPGRLSAETLRQPHTWLYGLFEMLQAIIAVYLLTLISPTEESLLRRFSIILSLAAAWLFFQRAWRRSDIIGSLAIFLGLMMIIAGFPLSTMISIAFLVFLGDVFNVGRTIMAETHPTSNQADTIKDRCRVTAYVLMVVSFFMVLFTLIIALGKYVAGANAANNPLLAAAPSLENFLHVPTLLAGMACGMVITGATRYLYLYASREAKSENFMMVAALTPLLTFLFEWLASLGGLVSIREVSALDVLAGSIITLASMYMVYGRYRTAKGV